jgi:hypothetical protein
VTALSVLIALLKAIPTLKEWFDQLVAMYIKSQIATMKEENKNAIHEALVKKDQRPIEKAIGSSEPGSRSGLVDSELRDSLPGVPKL